LLIILFEQTIIEIETQVKFTKKNKREKKHYERLHVLKILYENILLKAHKKALILKNNHIKNNLEKKTKVKRC
jgi:hypothetical protein